MFYQEFRKWKGSFFVRVRFIYIIGDYGRVSFEVSSKTIKLISNLKSTRYTTYKNNNGYSNKCQKQKYAHVLVFHS